MEAIGGRKKAFLLPATLNSRGPVLFLSNLQKTDERGL
jgi:hypothetical protein